MPDAPVPGIGPVLDNALREAIALLFGAAPRDASGKSARNVEPTNPVSGQ
jgi:hypothetical protein